MADPARDSGSRPPATPRWVKVLGIIAIIAILLIAIVLLTGGGHGPGRHTSEGDTGVGLDRGSIISTTAGAGPRPASAETHT
jgi:hypothetical protein